MNCFKLETGQIVYDPRGHLIIEPIDLAPRISSFRGRRLAVLDNSKWNGGKLLRYVVSFLSKDGFSAIRYYKKESFSTRAGPDLIKQIAEESDVALTAIGD
jgi:hypothetical protein